MGGDLGGGKVVMMWVGVLRGGGGGLWGEGGGEDRGMYRRRGKGDQVERKRKGEFNRGRGGMTKSLFEDQEQ